MSFSAPDEQPVGDRSDLIWVDSHCHLDMLKSATPRSHNDLANDPSPSSETLSLETVKIAEQALERAFDVGVGHFLCVSVDLADYAGLTSCALLSDRVARSAGIHPSTVENRSESQWAEELSSLLTEPEVVAVGETGLDYHYDTIDPKTQRQRYAVHIALSKQTSLPLIIHTREAREDTLALIRSEGSGDVMGVMHCFTETWQMAKAALDLGFYISFSGILTFKNAHELREVAKKVPLDRLLVETDSPYLAPVPYRGRSNTPALVPWVGQQLAQLKGMDVRELAEQTTANYFTLFSQAKNFGAGF